MPVAPISAVTANAFGTGTSGTSSSSESSASGGSSSASSGAGAASQLDRETFLKLLVAQLKYQDPSKPVDASEMISQSAQLSVVEKLDEISTALTESGVTNRLAVGGSIIGKQVTFTGTDGVRVTETVSAVSFDGTSMVLRAGTWDVPLEAVTAISSAPTSPAPSDSDS